MCCCMCLFLMSGCCLLWYGVVGMWGAVMHVVRGVPLWVMCVLRCVFVSVVHPVAILSAVFVLYVVC